MTYRKKKGIAFEPHLSFRAVHMQITAHLEKFGIEMLRIALAIIFIWFGWLKVVGMSPAQELVERTFYWFPPKVFVPFLGFWEVAIGVGLLIRRLVPYTVILLLIHMIGTFLPMFILTGVCYESFPYCPTLEGQYIIKNLVLIAGALTVAGKYKLEP